MSEWQPIETAPMDGTPLLLWGWNDVQVGWFCNDRDDDREWINADYDDLAPTHWMPLPAPPQQTRDSTHSSTGEATTSRGDDS